MLPWLLSSIEGSPTAHPSTLGSLGLTCLALPQPSGETLARKTSVKFTLVGNISIFS